jgi:hypothetical protein
MQLENIPNVRSVQKKKIIIIIIITHTNTLMCKLIYRILESPDGIFKVEITGSSKIGECRVWTETLDRQDGSFIIRYKIYNTCYNLKIEIKYKKKDVGNSPYVISGNFLCNL